MFIPTLQQWSPLMISALTGYLILVSFLRHQRARSLEKTFSPAARASFASMTTNDAQAILKDLTELEFPKFFGFSIIFALFKVWRASKLHHYCSLLSQTYGIPSVSSLLVTTGQLSDMETASKRIADTGVLLLEFALNAPTSDRALQAIARMNFLHARYQKAGKISNDDLLYTLSLFALEPARWVSKYEWRSLTDLELCACGTYWKSMGDAMKISFVRMPSCEKGWQDGLQWLKEVETWSEAYEKQNMVPAAANKQLADSHFEILCINVPYRFHGQCKRMMSVLLGERLRIAMMYVRLTIGFAKLTIRPRYPEAAPIYHSFVNGLLGVRKLLLCYCALPRPNFMRKQYIASGPDSKTGRYNSVEYLSYPWYIRPSFRRRWGPRVWLTRLVGRKLPGDDGNKYAPEGWTFSELGPQVLRSKGIKEMDSDHDRLASQDRGGCPFRLA